MSTNQQALNSLLAETPTVHAPRPMPGIPEVTLAEICGEDAWEVWCRFKHEVASTGYSPVWLGVERSVQSITENSRSLGLTVDEILEQAEELASDVDPLRWKKEKEEESLNWMKENDPEFYEQIQKQLENQAQISHFGEWPEDEGEMPCSTEFMIPMDHATNQSHESMFIGFVPTAKSWEIPAYLKLGNWNSCPPPQEHVAIMKHWQAAFGAELVGTTSDVIEMAVTKPPTTRQAALELAVVQEAYCEDIVTQGVETTSNLAATLKDGLIWYFWWD